MTKARVDRCVYRRNIAMEGHDATLHANAALPIGAWENHGWRGFQPNNDIGESRRVPDVYADLEARLTEKLTRTGEFTNDESSLSVGADNLLDRYPDRGPSRVPRQREAPSISSDEFTRVF